MKLACSCVAFATLTVACSSHVDVRGEGPAPYVESARFVAHSLHASGTTPLLLSPHDLVTKEDCSFRADGAGARCVSPHPAADAPMATLSPASDATTLTYLEARTPDGARFPLMAPSGRTTVVFDRHWALPCEVGYSPGVDQGDCAPPSADEYGFWADAACKVVLGAAGPDAKPAVLRGLDGYFAIGAEWTSSVFQGGPASCTVLDPPITSFRYYQRGAALADSEIAKIAIGRTGTGRLRIATLENEGRTVAVGYVGVSSDAIYHDEMLGLDCQPVRAADGAVRCYPGKLLMPDRRFADSSCTKPAVSGAPPSSVGFEDTTISEAPGSLPRVLSIWKASPDAKALTKHYEEVDGACVESGPSKEDLYALDGPDDWSRFEALEERIGARVVSP